MIHTWMIKMLANSQKVIWTQAPPLTLENSFGAAKKEIVSNKYIIQFAKYLCKIICNKGYIVQVN